MQPEGPSRFLPSREIGIPALLLPEPLRFPPHSREWEEAGGQVQGGDGSGKEEGTGEAPAGRERAAEQQQEASQER